jgi:hypothetical protein
MTLAHQQMSNDHEKLKQEEAEKSARLQELMYVKSNRNSKLTNDIINTKLSTPKKISGNKKSTRKERLNYGEPVEGGKKWSDEKIIDRICDYYDELQYNYEYFNNKSDDNGGRNGSGGVESDCEDNNSKNFTKTNNSSNDNLNQFYQLTKLRKNILNRKLIGHRERLKSEKLRLCNDTSLVTSVSSLVESLTIPTFHFHLILSLTMVLLTHQCPQYLLVL